MIQIKVVVCVEIEGVPFEEVRCIPLCLRDRRLTYWKHRLPKSSTVLHGFGRVQLDMVVPY